MLAGALGRCQKGLYGAPEFASSWADVHAAVYKSISMPCLGSATSNYYRGRAGTEAAGRNAKLDEASLVVARSATSTRAIDRLAPSARRAHAVGSWFMSTARSDFGACAPSMREICDGIEKAIHGGFDATSAHVRTTRKISFAGSRALTSAFKASASYFQWSEPG